MAKTKDTKETKEAPPPRSPRIALPPSPRVMLAYRIVKVVAMIAGFVATMIGLMACIGALTENGYARLLGALVVTVAVPLGIGDRLLPEDDPVRAKGLITEVMALVWVAFGFVFATVANGATRGLLTREGDRLRKEGYELSADAAYFLAGVHANKPPPEVKPDPSASASASASAASSAPASATATESGATSAAATASATATASAAPKSDKPEKTPAELFKTLAPSVVTIFVKGSGDAGGSGTGFVIDKSATIVTNHHVIDGGKAVKIKLFGGASYTDVELLADDANLDLALLHVDPAKPTEGSPADFPPVTLGDSDTIVVGERAVSIGNPLGLEHTLTDGLVSARRMYEGRAWIQMSVPVSPGNSGGPLFDMQGEVIGITTAQIGAGAFGRAQNLNLAVPVNELKKLIKPAYPGKRRFGDEPSGKSQW
jgi:uncharacterized membrane protein YiaA